MKTNKAVHFVECLSNMTSIGEESSFYDYTLEWMSSIDRGGLFCISYNTFSFFKAIEVKTQDLLPQHLATKCKGDVPDKGDLIQRIAEDDDVQFWWSMLAIYIPDENLSAELLRMLIDMWVTIRGFSVGWNSTILLSVRKSKRLRESLQQGRDH